MKHKIHILTSDKYLEALLPFAWLLKKYWIPEPDVIVGGFTPPDFALPPNFHFHSIGDFNDYPIERWSDGLIKFLNDIDDEIVCLFLEDMWIIQPVYSAVVDMAYDYMKQFEYVARLDLTGDRLHAGGAALYGDLGHVKLIWSDPNSPYHLSTMPAFWRKEHLLKVLLPNETPWNTEISGTPRLAWLRNEMIVLGTNAWPVKNTLAFRGGETTKLLLDELAPADVAEMRELGLFTSWEEPPD